VVIVGYSFPKGNVPWNKGTKGLMVTPHNKIDISKDELKKEIKTGKKQTELAEKYNCGVGVINRLIKDHNLEDYVKKYCFGGLIDIKSEGIDCGKCGFNCTIEEASKYFSRMARFHFKYRSGWGWACKECAATNTRKNYTKRRLKENPDYKPQLAWFYNETHAECSSCEKILPREDFHMQKRSPRGCTPTCKPCTSHIEFKKRRKNMKATVYRRYKSQMRNEGNDCDMTYEEFLEIWPWDNKCPILGHELNFFPEDERGKWVGGRLYPYTPCVDHIDPREELSKNNLQIICWRANELKSDAIPAEIHLLSIYMKDVFSVGSEIFDDMGYKDTLRETGWVGKYANMD
jgi:hypothetical protein